MDLAQQFGDLPISRLRLDRFPATEADVIELHDKENRLYELVDGVLVEKTMGYREGYIAVFIARMLGNFVEPRNLGIVNGADGMMKLAPELVRIPDVSYVSWAQFPGGVIGAAPIPSIYPELAVEVLSPSNTRKEMDAKRQEYFDSGTALLWIIDPDARTVEVYGPANPDVARTFRESDTLAGEPVLPGFMLSVASIFEKLAR